MSTAPDDPALADLKTALRATWSAGDYGAIARPLERSSLAFLGRYPASAGERVLDACCGTGQIAIPVARAGAAVTGIDIAASSIRQAGERAAAEALDIRFELADVEDLPFEDGAFDAVYSLIGAMFAPRPERAAAEMLRVCRRGGRIVMGNWTPQGFVGRLFATVARHVSPPDMPSPLLWGDPDTVRARLGPGSREIETREGAFRFHYPFGEAEVVAHYARNFGPIMTALGSLDESGQTALRADLEALWREANQARDGTTLVDAGILEVVAHRA